MDNTIRNHKERQSNFELLRIILMFFIVAHHLMGQSGALDNAVGFNAIFNHTIGHAARISVNVYIMIGCYFMVGKAFQGKRFVKLWLTKFFYVVSIASLMFFFVPDSISKTWFFWAFFPIWGWQYHLWFVGIYLILILLAPFLNRFLPCERAVYKKLLIVLLVLIVGWCSTHSMEDTYLDCVGWFVFIFLLMGYYKIYLRESIPGKKRWLLLSVVIYGNLVFLLVAPKLGFNGGTFQLLSKWAGQYLSDYKSFPNLLSAFSLFHFFSKLSIGTINWINWLSTSTLAVYLVHQVGGFYPYLWEDILHVSLFINSPLWPVYFICVMIFLFLTITLFDKSRIYYLEQPLMRTREVRYVCHSLDCFYAPVDGVSVCREETPYPQSKREKGKALQLVAAILMILFALSNIHYPIKVQNELSIHFAGENWNASNYVESGISNSEDIFTWSNGNRIVFRELIFENAIDKELSVTVLGSYNGTQTCRILANEQLIYDGVVNDRCDIKVVIPSILGKAINLSIELPDAVSPLQLGLSQDNRVLGIQLYQISICPLK